MRIVPALKRAPWILGGIALAAALQAAQGPGVQEERTPFGRGAKHPLKAVLPKTHPLAQDDPDHKNFTPIEQPATPGPDLKDSDEAYIEIEYDAATKKVRKGQSAKKRPRLQKLPKAGLGLDNRVQLDPRKIRQRTVFEGDRKPVSDLLWYPWRAVVKLFMRFPNGAGRMGSGIMVAPRYCLTAGHCVYEKALGGWATSIEVIPGYSGMVYPAYKPFGSAWMTHSLSFNGWTYYQSVDHDIAVIRLDRQIGYSCGWLGYFNYASNTGTWAYTAGFPGDLNSGRQMYWDVDQVLSETTNVVRHKADTYKGQSGSGLWRYSGSYGYVFAIHANGFPDVNLGTRLNSSRASAINAYIAAVP